MKKYNTKLVAALALTATFSSGAYAVGKSVNQELSDVRTQISKQMLENKLYQAQLDGLQKQQEIKKIQNSLDGVSSTSSSSSRPVEIEEDHSFKFNNSIHEEDILSENNNWEQNVGFIYQDDIMLGGMNNKNITSNDAIGSLTEDDDIDFAEMLDKVAAQANEDLDDSTASSENSESSSESLSSLNEFKLISVDLQKLDIYDDKRKASVKVNYITNNGYQKIKGSKIISVSEGSSFNVKGKNSFEVLSITDSGVKYKNLTNGQEGFATR